MQVRRVRGAEVPCPLDADHGVEQRAVPRHGRGRLGGGLGRHRAPCGRGHQVVPVLAALGDVYALVGRTADAEQQFATVEFIGKLEALNQVLYNRQLVLFRANHNREIEGAVDAARRELFDVVLMDVQMPTMDGFEATAAIRALPSPANATVPIVALTAHAMQGDENRCLVAGMDAYLAKPVDIRTLVELVRRGLVELRVPGQPSVMDPPVPPGAVPPGAVPTAVEPPGAVPTAAVPPGAGSPGAAGRLAAPGRHLPAQGAAAADPVGLAAGAGRLPAAGAVADRAAAALVDPGKLEHALINLAVNARDAMPDGGKLVFSTSIENLEKNPALIHPDLQPGIYNVIRVTDNGRGIPKENHARIFEPFFTDKEQGKGTGLGLAVCRALMERQGGTIHLAAGNGRGAAFVLSFPIAYEEATP